MTRNEGYLREARVVLQARYTDKAGLKIPMFSSVFVVNQIDLEGKFAYELVE